MTKPTVVLVQVNNLELGGTQLNAVDLAWALRPHGYESVFVGFEDSVPEGRSLLPVFAEREVPLHIIPRPKTTIGGARDLNRLARAHDAAIMHVYCTYNPRPAYWGPCLLGRRPLVHTVYEMAMAWHTYRATDLIVGTRYLLEEQEDRRGGVRLVSPPVDLDRDRFSPEQKADFIREYELNPSDRRVVIVSRLDEEMKALTVELAIDAIRRLPENDVQLVVVGGGDAAERLRRLGDEANAHLGRRAVVFIGPLADPRPAYSAADVMIGMGGSAARSLAFGKPLIVSGEFGWFVPFDRSTSAMLFRNSFWSADVQAQPSVVLAHELEKLLAAPELRASLGHYGRAFAEQSFGLQAMAERIAAVYQRALGRYGAREWASDLDIEAEFARRRAARLISTATERMASRGAAVVDTGLS